MQSINESRAIIGAKKPLDYRCVLTKCQGDAKYQEDVKFPKVANCQEDAKCQEDTKCPESIHYQEHNNCPEDANSQKGAKSQDLR